MEPTHPIPPSPIPEPAASPALPQDAAAPGPTPSPSPRPLPQDQQASRRQQNLLGGGLLGLGVLLAIGLLWLWPEAKELSGDKPLDRVWLGWHFTPNIDTLLLLLVMLCGALGSFIHTATSFADFVGNRRLGHSWLWWYGLKPFIGMALAVVLYLVTRGGLLGGSASAKDLNLYGLTALAGLAGMFSKQATDKLSEVFSTLFANQADAARKDSLNDDPPATDASAPTKS